MASSLTLKNSSHEAGRIAFGISVYKLQPSVPIKEGHGVPKRNAAGSTAGPSRTRMVSHRPTVDIEFADRPDADFIPEFSLINELRERE